MEMHEQVGLVLDAQQKARPLVCMWHGGMCNCRANGLESADKLDGINGFLAHELAGTRGTLGLWPHLHAPWLYSQVDLARGNPPPPCTNFRLSHDMVPELLMIWEMIMVREFHVREAARKPSWVCKTQGVQLLTLKDGPEKNGPAQSRGSMLALPTHCSRFHCLPLLLLLQWTSSAGPSYLGCA
eukprot:scaffold254383_cov20-Tisochrysis_lutea.AAC.1